MFDNKSLNIKIKKLLKDLQKKNGVSLYRVAKETSIPHSSLKYMLDNRFEWKLNHLYRLVNFLKNYRDDITIDSLLGYPVKGGTADGSSTGKLFMTSPTELQAFSQGSDPNVGYRYLSKEAGRKICGVSDLSSDGILSGSDEELAESICRLLGGDKEFAGKKVTVRIKVFDDDEVPSGEMNFKYSR